MKKLEEKSQITLIVQSMIVIILFFICEALFFTYLDKPVFYIIGVIFLLLTLLLCKLFKFNLFSFKALKRNEIVLIIISFLVIEITTYLITTFFPMPSNQESLSKMVDQSNLIVAIITLGILIPIIEECICRGILIKVLFQKSQRIGVIISILLFTFAHGPSSVIDFIIYGLPAVIYSVIYYKTKRLEIPIIIHIMNNLYVFLA
ncbi:CPBP family intramembrane glutamic endopeptidase [Staphylococcus hominis]|uniref:CPBP family intramembrane glutamic endopeptidase n=1 Tax=Staphylococcus hominis TaxID=1290 RepID=UPI00066EAE31|nr:type II CAAX endopeptidase family protein [Staphylococcus hominis]MCT1471391.1 CPBP family intramembrane metalloprotease [Staphylococcus hominis]NAM96301.1 CPBP family intramembrane metalloprotease [Staphylococcus hominis]TRL61496.1 CPBP family intramembrane metalloprotease [Staphylococcus hominis]